MPNCTKYMELSEIERQIFDTELLHACRSDDMFFERGQKLIKAAKKKKVFNGTIIRPTGNEIAEEKNIQ